jgi:hypothetical protein
MNEKNLSFGPGRKLFTLLTGLMIATLGWAAAEPPHAAVPASAAPSFNDIASVLAGFPGETPSLAGVRASAAWKLYVEAIEKSWAELESKRLDPMRAWADKELIRARASSDFLFYPFGGPDFLTAFEFFPQAETFVLLGLEFCGRLPRFDLWTSRQCEAYLNNFRTSLSDFFDKSYFITKHMDETIYGQAQVEGVLPLLCFFLRRTGHSILSVERIDYDAQGNAIATEFDKAGKARRPYGIKVQFAAAGSSRVKTIIYVSCDLEDKVFTKESALFKNLGLLPAGLTTYVKSASYLLHYATFRNIREIILDKSRFVLQDDTGIPYAVFKAKDWRILLYGQYAKPIKDFSGVDQPDLKKAFEENAEAIAKLPFHLGYHWRDNLDALILAEKKNGRGESR